MSYRKLSCVISVFAVLLAECALGFNKGMVASTQTHLVGDIFRPYKSERENPIPLGLG